MSQTKDTYLVEECEGCGHRDKIKCKVITEPHYMWRKRGSCFAKITKEEAEELEKLLAFINRKC